MIALLIKVIFWTLLTVIIGLLIELSGFIGCNGEDVNG
jgi:hypothetical protein